MPTIRNPGGVDRRHAVAWLGAAGLGLPLGAGTVRADHCAPADDLSVALAGAPAVPGSGLVGFEIDGDRLRFAATAAPGAPPPDARTPVEIGSITKTFTALLLADAATRGAFGLDDAVEAVLPGALRLRDVAGQPLRWRDLATHRSGLPRLPDNLDTRAADPYAGYGWADLERFLRDREPTRRRDEVYEYSNLGFGLLGQALAFHAGVPYAELLRRRVFEPLGLGDARVAVAGRAAGAAGHDAQGRPAPAWHFTDATAGAGGVVCDARALARFARAALGLVDHPLRDAFALCLRRHADGAAPMNPTGLAWILAPLNGRTVFNHDGGTAGFAASLWLDPQRRRAAAVLANAATPVTGLALHLLDRSVPPPAASPADADAAAGPVDADALAVLAGVYALGPQFGVTVRAEGARLFARATGQDEFELFRRAGAATRRFFARVAALEIEFDGAEGPAPAFTLHQAGQRLRFERR